MRTCSVFVAGMLPLLAAAAASGVTCSYSTAAASGDTCATFAASWGLSESDFQALNPDAACPDLVSGTSYCVFGKAATTSTTTTRPVTSTTTSTSTTPTATLPTVVTCEMSTAANEGDTCRIFAQRWGTDLSLFKQLNPSVNCDNALVGGDSYCVTGSIDTVTALPNTTTSTLATSTIDWSSDTLPTQSGLASDCANYYLVRSDDSCDSIESNFNITSAEFEAWNTAIASDCTNLESGYYVCVGLVQNTTTTTTSATATATATAVISPTQSGIASDCSSYHLVKTSDNCYNIETKYSITADEFNEWNPAIDASCANLYLGYYVCVGVDGNATVSATAKPTTATTASTTAKTTSTSTTSTASAPTFTGTTSDCDQYYEVVSGDSCGAIETKYNVSLSQLVKWNTGLADDCSNLLLGYKYCVHVPGAKQVPSPLMTGTSDDCSTYHKIVSGDYCYLIETDNGISDTDFRALNTGINSDCSNLLLGYYVCVAA
ncbi:hypothetical protein F503_07308 [Ophiostoma piceae UAMH 11346]|uniref:LysM domain-containing protein n=1 Tax=Ophiostoma piceae (strain UAMH 11346) TaxID=1262450 RepID=S3C9K2_OPHP1|nr:hypothetical protein F503_07308 [Ophiostoma piceae UAMH 11346]